MQENDTNRRLKTIENKLDNIAKLMEKVAVQKNRIDTIEKRVDSLWSKWDHDIAPVLLNCPSKQIKWLWSIIIPQGLLLITTSFLLLRSM